MIETVKINKIFKSDKKKDGSEFKTKAGKKFWKVGIITDKYPEKWYTAFAWAADDEVMGLQEGDERKIVLWQDGDWLNFKLPTRLDELEARVEALETTLRAMNMAKSAAKPSMNHTGEQTEPVITDDDLPF